MGLKVKDYSKVEIYLMLLFKSKKEMEKNNIEKVKK